MVATVLAATMICQRDRQAWGQTTALAMADATLAQAETDAKSSPTAAPTAGPSREVSWWPWILALPGLGGLWWWMLRETPPQSGDQGLAYRLPALARADIGLGEGATEQPASTEAAAHPSTPAQAERRIILVPRSSHGAYAYWELPDAEVEALKQRQCSLALKVHDVTDIAQVDQQPPHATDLWDCPTQATGDLHLSIAQENREYLLELGYRDESDTWHALVRSAAVRSLAFHVVDSDTVDPADSGITDPLVASSPAAADLPAPATSPDPAPSFVPRPTAQATLTPQTCRSAQAHWELSPEHLATLKTGNHRLTVHLYDVTELPGGFSAGPNSMQTFEVDPVPQVDPVLPIAVDDRDYLIEVGYVTENGQWQVLAKSSPVRVPACSP
ncbi:MAG: DUF4912 domain-containing protein [Spirulina sp.]